MTDRCDKTGMDRRFCSHCQGTARGTQGNPEFSIKEDFDEGHGYPVVEILKDGAQIHEHDKHFRFGRRKAKIVLACLPALKTFGWPPGDENLQFREETFPVPEFGTRVRVSVEAYPYFARSTGEQISEPWLRLQTVPYDELHLGLGRMKCRAVWSVQDQLRNWVNRL